MVHRAEVDLSAHINQNVEHGHPADFPVVLQPVYYPTGEDYGPVPDRVAVVRQDTNRVLAIVSKRYRLVTHQQLLDCVAAATTTTLDVGPVPRGIYVDRGGARMRALFKFPALARPISVTGEICPCVKIENTYDGTSRVSVHIGAFRFVCTNLAVGGGGVFGGGFMSVHAGEIDIEQISAQLARYLGDFERIVRTYSAWSESVLELERHDQFLETLPSRPAEALRLRRSVETPLTVYSAYNQATQLATHHMRSVRGAFDLLERVNRGFQRFFPSYPHLVAPDETHGRTPPVGLN